MKLKKYFIFFLLQVLVVGVTKAQNYNMGNLGTITNACGGNFYDSGGPGSNYSNNELYTATFCAPPGQYISFTFTSFNIESNFDWLDVYNGPNTLSPYIGSYTGNLSTFTITSTLGGCLTFVFDSDGSVTSSGWVAQISCGSTPPSTGDDCNSANPFCTGTTYTFANNTNQPNLGAIDCLYSTPNPVWYYMQIANPGNLNIDIAQYDNFGFPIDVDFDLWGPFPNIPTGCAAIYNGTAPSVDCSYSASAFEQANIVGAQTGEVYILLLTNYSNTAGTITFNAASGSTATTDCSILCNITNVTANPSVCNTSTNTYSVSGQVTVTNPPNSGSLILSTSCGGSVSISAPFTSPISYTISGIPATGGACNVTASFSADASCSYTQSYTAPASCGSSGLNCPTYANTSTSPNTACAGQVYYFDVANTGCNGTITFNVVGNYGSLWANEITWEVTSLLTGTTIASGGPGSNGASFNVTVGPLNPAVVGNIFTLYVYDSYGDGFYGGGYITVQQPLGTNLFPQITGNFGLQASTMFGANIAISPATITITTPTGPITSTVTGCNNFHVPITLQNVNLCNTINVNLPFTITCQSTGAVISTGSKSVTVYPSLPTTASDLVDISFNSSTCTYTMTPQNDCIAANIGSIFTVTPNPSTVTSPSCTAGGQTFTVEYYGLGGGPNCCSTGGPLIPITYQQTFPSTSVTAVNSPFGGVNNAAYITIPPYLIGGNATSLNFTLNINNYCFNYFSTSYWVTILVDGVIVSDTWYNPALINNTISLNLSSLPNGYNQNSTIQVYVYPNTLSPSTFIPNGNCGSLSYGTWTASISAEINATFADQQPTPAVCTFNPFLPFSCCVSNVVSDDAASICSGGSLSQLSTWQSNVSAANSTCIVYSSVTPVAGSVLPDNLLPDGINNTGSQIQQIVSAYSYCDVDGSGTVNSGDTYTLVSTFTLTVNPAPDAGTNGTLVTCTNGSTVDLYSYLGGTPQNTGIWSGPSSLAGGYLGTFNPAVNLSGLYTYTVVGASCPDATATVNVTVNSPVPTSVNYVGNPFCADGGSVSPVITGTTGGTFSASPSGLNIDAAGGINPTGSTPGTYTITYNVPASGGCPPYTVSTIITIEPLPIISLIYHD
ncbi:MAG: CUB domain-containing protein [Bacteroidia bacterium]|nr:CUB domain-containing protein [Bacteroidia bacterium]